VYIVERNALQHLHKRLDFVSTVFKARQRDAHDAVVLAYEVDGIAGRGEVNAVQGGQWDGNHVEE